MDKNLIFNFLLDLKKKEINPFERGQIIKLYLKENYITKKVLSERLRINEKNIDNWLLWTTLTEQEYNKMKISGLTDNDIYDILKGSKSVIIDSKINFELKSSIEKLGKLVKKTDQDKKTRTLIKELKDILNRMSMYNEGTVRR